MDRLWKEVVVAYSRYNIDICLKGTRNTINTSVGTAGFQADTLITASRTRSMYTNHSAAMLGLSRVGPVQTHTHDEEHRL
jgi:hypothetical protein